MLVTGGRFGWARLVWLGGFAIGVLGLGGTAACGSRTSMLDPDAYSVGEGGSSNTSPLGNAGKSSPGSGGRPIGAAGTTAAIGGSNSSGVDPSIAVGVCQQYCPGYSSQCQKRLKGQACIPTCQGELNNFGPVCQALGVKALSCLTPFFSRGGVDCDGAVNRALAQCSGIVTQFEECKKDFSASPGNPSFNFISSCERSGGPMDDGNCAQIFNCTNGPYITLCNPSGSSSKQLQCSCVTPNGQTLEARLPASGDPCLDATALCL